MQFVWNFRCRWVWAGLALLASGCVATDPFVGWVHNGFKVGPNYCRPPAPVAEDWIQANDPNVRKNQLAEWWDVFEDPALDHLVDTAYGQNLNLRVLGTRVLQARAQQAVTAGNIFPQTQQLNGSYYYGNFANSPFHLDLTNFNLSWELDFWGRFRRSIESANAGLDGSVENYDAALVTLLGDVATNYVQYRVAQQRIKIARDNVRIQESVLALVEQQFKVGINKVTALDVDQAKTVLEQTRSTIPALEITLGTANDTLCTLLGMPPHDLEHELGPDPPLGTNPMPNTPAWVAAGIPADLLRRRPDVRAAERQVAAQSAQIGVAEAEFYPHLAINGTIGYDAIIIPPLVTNSGFLGIIQPNFTWNILNYGRICNNVRLQKAKTQELIAAYQDQVLTAAREAQIAIRAFLRSREQAEFLARSVKAAVAATQVGVNQYRAGVVPFNTVFNLETTQVQQQDQLAVAQGNIALNLIAVYRALGGGWEMRLRESDCGPGPGAASDVSTWVPTAREPEQLPVPTPTTP